MPMSSPFPSLLSLVSLVGAASGLRSNYWSKPSTIEDAESATPRQKNMVFFLTTLEPSQ